MRHVTTGLLSAALATSLLAVQLEALAGTIRIGATMRIDCARSAMARTPREARMARP